MRTPFPLLLVPLLLAPGTAGAKDLRNRPGVGFATPVGSFPSLSVRYGLPMPDPVINVQVEALAGFSVDGDATTPDGFSAGARLLYAVVAEDNLNLYAAAGAGWTTVEGSGTFTLQPGLGVEFFLFGLENLGFAAEWGVAVGLGTPTGAATFGTGPGAGLHYYF